MKTLLLFLFLFLSQVMAQAPASAPDSGLSAGVSYIERTNLFKSAENDSFPLPFVAWRGESFYVRGISVGYYLYKKYPQINLILQPTLLEVDNDEGTYNEDLSKRHRTLNAGFEVVLPTSWLMVVWQWHHDILNVYKGWATSLEFKKRFQYSEKLGFHPSFGFYLHSKSYVDYYFGVDADEAKIDRPVYEPKIDLGWGPTLMTIYSLDDHWNLMLMGRYLKYGSEVSKSPLIARNDQWTFMLGATKKFD